MLFRSAFAYGHSKTNAISYANTGANLDPAADSYAEANAVSDVNSWTDINAGTHFNSFADVNSRANLTSDDPNSSPSADCNARNHL